MPAAPIRSASSRLLNRTVEARYTGRFAVWIGTSKRRDASTSRVPNPSSGWVTVLFGFGCGLGALESADIKILSGLQHAECKLQDARCKRGGSGSFSQASQVAL